METIIKIKDSVKGKKLIAHLKSLDYVKVLGNASNFVAADELREKVKKAEKSKALTLEEAERRSEGWKNSYK